MTPRYSLVLLASLLLIATPASADDHWDIHGPNPSMGPTLGTCAFGNQEPITVAGPLWEVGAESTLLVDPADDCTVCEFGVRVYWINTTIWVDADCDVTVRTKFRSYDDTDPSCKTPGKVECMGSDQTYSLSPGFNRIDVSNSPCLCADINYHYLLGLELVSTDCGEVRRTSDEVAAPGPECTSYYIDPAGVVHDEADGGIPGRLGYFAYAECCEKPVSNDESSFGDVKGRFDEDDDE